MDKNKYFDWAATSLPDEDLLKEALELSIEYSGNPSSVHDMGTKAKEILDNARKTAAKALNVKPEQIIFTSGGTESDQFPFLALLNKPTKGSILVSNIEHPAVSKMAESMKKTGWKVDFVNCNKDGIVMPEAVESCLKDDTALVCVMAVNNETGAIQPIEEIAAVIEKHYDGKRKPKFHVDIVQAVGKIPVNLTCKGIDSAAISAHKICGPRGIGILYLKSVQESFLKGGGQENNIRSGTENLFGIIALSKCLEKYATETAVKKTFETETAIVAKFLEETAYNEEFKKIAKVIPFSRKPIDERFSPSVVQLSFANIPGQVLVRTLSSKGFYVSTGSACSAKKQNRPILKAMGISDEDATNAVRFSFGPHTTLPDVEELLSVLKDVIKMFNS